MPKLSIITVCRNESARIGQTIESIVGQSCPAFEWIVVDGDSSDNTLEQVRCHGARLTRLISEPDRGLYDAMNKGIATARGEYLLFMNAGDRLADSDVVGAFLDNNFTADLVVGDIRIILKSGRELYRKSTDKKLDPDLLYWRTLPHQATFIKRSMIKKIGVYDLSFEIASDWEFFARAIVRHNVLPLAWPHCVAIYPHDGISARMVNRAQINRERNRIRAMFFPTPYRWRRECNESWGRMVHWFRQRVFP